MTNNWSSVSKCWDAVGASIAQIRLNMANATYAHPAGGITPRLRLLSRGAAYVTANTMPAALLQGSDPLDHEYFLDRDQGGEQGKGHERTSKPSNNKEAADAKPKHPGLHAEPRGQRSHYRCADEGKKSRLASRPDGPPSAPRSSVRAGSCPAMRIVRTHSRESLAAGRTTRVAKRT